MAVGRSLTTVVCSSSVCYGADFETRILAPAAPPDPAALAPVEVNCTVVGPSMGLPGLKLCCCVLLHGVPGHVQTVASAVCCTFGTLGMLCTSGTLGVLVVLGIRLLKGADVQLL